MRSLIVLAALTLAVVTACSSDDELDSESTSDPTAETFATEQATPCDLLSDDEVTELAGEPVEGPDEADVGGLTACKWQADEVWVQAIAVPAETWAQQLPELVDQMTASGMFDDDENLRKLEEGRDLVVAGEDVDSAEACELFSAMLEIQGQAPGGERIITVLPTREDPQAVSAQACIDGTFASVLLVRPDLSGSAAEQERVEDALDLVTSVE